MHRLRRAVRDQYSFFHPSNPYYKWMLLVNVMIGTFMAVLDATIVNVGLTKIMSSFGVGIDKIEWVVTAYMLATAVMLPTSGWLADRFGYKRIYFLGLLFFTLGSFLCGISSTEDFLIFSRVIQGLGAGALMPVGMAIITREFPPHQRGIAIGFWSIASAASVSFGPLIGGYLIDNFNWPLIFDVNVPIGVLGMIATVIVQKEFVNRRVRGFDPVGLISVSIFLPVLLYALSEGSATTNSGGWTSPVILACFAISLVALAVFLTTELSVKNPLIDLRLFRDYNFSMSNLIMFIFSVGMFGSTFLLPLFLQNSLNYTAIQAGAVFLPVGIIQGFVAPVTGILSDRTNPKIPILIGVGLLGFSFILNSHLSFLTEHAYIMLILYIRGFAMGIIFTPLSAVSMLTIKREQMAQASGLFNVIRQIGGSFGVAVFATILTTRTEFHMENYSQAVNTNNPVYQQTTRNLSRFAQTGDGSTATIAGKQASTLLVSHIARQAFIESVNDDFLLAGIITWIGGIPIFFLRARKKGKPEGLSPPGQEPPAGSPDESIAVLSE